MTPEQFLPLAKIKAKCGIPTSNTDLDDLLMDYLKAAIARIESVTRRNILDRPAVKILSPDPARQREFIRFFAYDIKPLGPVVTIRYKSAGDPGFAREQTLTIPSKFTELRSNQICVYNATSDGVTEWPEHDPTVALEATLDLGMAVGAAPPEFAVCALTLIREMQEGTILDALPNNILDLLLKDHVKPPITEEDEIRIAAGIE